MMLDLTCDGRKVDFGFVYDGFAGFSFSIQER